jgi:hypothetical protein
LRAITLALALFAVMGSAAHAEKRVALVIGNSAYTHARALPLPNPDNDAKLMSDTLLSLGFFVVGGGAKLDLDKAGFDAALNEFQKELAGADVALFYYAGHSVETHGLNYLVPTDANPANDDDVLAQGIGLAGILDDFEKAPQHQDRTRVVRESGRPRRARGETEFERNGTLGPGLYQAADIPRGHCPRLPKFPRWNQFSASGLPCRNRSFDFRTQPDR